MLTGEAKLIDQNPEDLPGLNQRVVVGGIRILLNAGIAPGAIIPLFTEDLADWRALQQTADLPGILV